MILKKNISIILLLILMASCKKTKSITGVWVDPLNQNRTIEFTDDGYYFDSKLNNRNRNFSGMVQKLDGTTHEVDYGKLRYAFENSNQENFDLVRIYGEKNNVVFRKKSYLLDDGENSIIECTYKQGSEEIDNHLQICSRYFFKGKDQKFSRSKNQLHIIFPDKFDGDVIYIAFNQHNPDYPYESHQVVTNSEGLAEFPFSENIKAILDGNVRAFEKNENGSLKPVFTFQANNWAALLKDIGNRTNKKYIPVPLDSTIVFSSRRFNPSRSFVDKTFGKTIKGNVLALRRSSIRKELFYLGYDNPDQLNLIVAEEFNN